MIKEKKRWEMSFTKTFVVSKRIEVPLYEGTVKNFFARVDITTLDEYPVKYQISDKSHTIDKHGWNAANGTATAIMDKWRCTHCYLVLEPYVPQAVAHVRVDFDFSADTFDFGDGFGDDNGDDEPDERVAKVKTAAITFVIVLVVFIAIAIFALKKMKARSGG